MNEKCRKILGVLLTVNPERMVKIVDSIKGRFSFPIDIFIGYTPENSGTYIKEFFDKYPEKPGTISCFRSYAALFNKYKNYDIDYLITFEDDILLDIDYEEKMLKTIELFEKYPENDYVLLGYNLSLDINKIREKYDNEQGYYYNVWSYSSIWGAQSMLFKKSTLSKIADIFHKETTTIVRENMLNLIIQNKQTRLNNKALRLQADSCIPVFLKYSIIYPPIAIESEDFRSDIDRQQNSQYYYLKNHPDIDIRKYK